jgi:phospholipid/cholesterol/gamma-HCH transport system substrate-binding protein
METRANYILIGIFTLLGFFGLLAFLLWFARVELDRQFAYFDVNFDSVSGLSRASDVRFSGLPVGQVVNVALSPDGDGTVRVRIEIAADVPVRTDSVATIEAQGVTGVSFVGISAGSPDAPLLTAEPGEPIPQIEAGRSVLQSLTEDAPQILTEVLSLVQDLRDLIGGENQDRIDNILTNIEGATENFAIALDDFSVVTASVSGFAVEISRFNATLDELTGAFTQVLTTADETLEAYSAIATDARDLLEAGTGTLTTAQEAVAEAERLLAGEVAETLAAARDTVVNIQRQVDDIGTEARTMIASFTDAGTAATARLTEAEATIVAADAMIERLNETLETIDTAAAEFDAFITGDATEFVAETRAAVTEATETIRSVNALVEADLPTIVADIRSATGTATRVIEEVGADLSSASGRIEGLSADASAALTGVTETFGNANTTLAAINDALAVGERTLAAAERTLDTAERTFDGADRVINQDVSAITADLRATLARLDETIAQVSDDIPGITADLRAASDTARQAFEEIGTLVTASGAPLRDFAASGLPQFTRLAQESRSLVTNLERLTRQIERSPTRFFLDRQTPEFRR